LLILENVKGFWQAFARIAELISMNINNLNFLIVLFVYK